MMWKKRLPFKFKSSVTVSLIVAIAFFMQFLDTTAVNTAIPVMASSFGVDVIHLSTGVTSYLIALAIFIPVSGWIADRFGTRNVFCTAVVFFILASTLIMWNIDLFDPICLIPYIAGNGRSDDVSRRAFGRIENHS